MKDSFKSEAMTNSNPKWEQSISRIKPLIKRNSDLRSEFSRDYNRIIYSNGYRRLKHKTQVFFSPKNDHICTRGEHVTHVESISYTIANYLGLNTELTKAISVSHDIGHSPFGHSGERVLSQISLEDLGVNFWHERNGLHFVDSIELLENHEGYKKNLNLTYAVRDGIISHCGEITEQYLRPRDEAIDLNKDYISPSQYAPYTWEGCVVKIADNISYIGRDIEDAITLGIIDKNSEATISLLNDISYQKLNNSRIINYLINDLCSNSSLESGLRFSDEAFSLMKKVKDFNYKYIYFSDRVKPATKFFNIVINEIYETLKKCFDGKNTLENIKKLAVFYPKLSEGFYYFLENYCNFGNRESLKLQNEITFDYTKKEDYCRSIISYIAGMTDNFAIKTYNEIIGF